MIDLFLQAKEPGDDNDDMGIVAPTDEDPAEEPIEGEEDTLGDVANDGISDDEDELE